MISRIDERTTGPSASMAAAFRLLLTRQLAAKRLARADNVVTVSPPTVDTILPHLLWITSLAVDNLDSGTPVGSPRPQEWSAKLSHDQLDHEPENSSLIESVTALTPRSVTSPGSPQDWIVPKTEAGWWSSVLSNAAAARIYTNTPVQSRSRCPKEPMAHGHHLNPCEMVRNRHEDIVSPAVPHVVVITLIHKTQAIEPY